MKPKYALEPLNGSYRIVALDEYTRPIVFEADLPLETMEDILYAFETRSEEVYNEGFSNGYAEGWDDCLVTESDE